MHVAHALGVARDVEQQRRGDVVRQVAHQAQAGGKAREVELERVRAVHGQPEGRKARGERRGEIAVELDRFELARALDQRAGERALAGPDLHQEIVGRRRNRIDDAREHARVVEEMLAEPLTRPMRGRWQA